ncbi:hypothetical protein [Flavilitoribacter nigricans]|uniref:Membrane-binding protein n=1 Tax=Flavilitoribacter nigricans (strain ATCC 23147 / DSM 23189 / NBRC 102662 / NCIMB 1420 / SS-2) TaxID=1122177 RepID=A0A2D0N388_FLAN2|nr:hypothetical protein [Flavilitoribacter nigricans]PHN02860.1 hypothetical protein CRP01_30240 [Flavilitoribacter nigricans DSM 23189 = NBRC 102662]
MKILTTLIFSLSLGLMASAATAPHAINGYWKNDKFQVVIELQVTDYGFKTMRTDRDRWYHYDWSFENVYSDQDGNRYIVYDEQTLVWEANDGRRLQFRKLEQRGIGDYRPEPAVATTALGGHWTDFHYDAQLRVIPERGGFKARIWNGAWRFYDRLDHNTFQDRYGNTFTLQQNGKLKYQDSRSRRVYFFEHTSDRL